MTPDRIAAEDRVAPVSDHVLTGPVTLMNSFAVSPGRDEAFHELWARTAKYFYSPAGVHLPAAAPGRLRRCSVPVGERRELGVGGALPGRARHR
jgi:hypothetical protein